MVCTYSLLSTSQTPVVGKQTKACLYLNYISHPYAALITQILELALYRVQCTYDIFVYFLSQQTEHSERSVFISDRTEVADGLDTRMKRQREISCAITESYISGTLLYDGPSEDILETEAKV